MKSHVASLLVLLAVSLAGPATCVPAAEPLEAGVAVVDITPPGTYRLSGYFHQRLSTGTHDPLLAKAIVLRQGSTQAAIVACDLIGLPLGLTSRVRREAEKRSGIPAENILLAATHSHTGPLYFGAMRKELHDRVVAQTGSDPAEKIDYPALLAKGLLRAIDEARAALGPVELAAGTAQQQGLSFNRRFFLKNSDVVVFNPGKLNPNIIRPAGPIDPEVDLFLFRRPGQERPLASLTVFALHLDTVGGTEYSADFPFYLSKSLQGRFGPRFVSVFANGTCGDINHVDVSTRDPQKGQAEARRIGTTLAKTVQAGLEHLQPVGRPSLAVRSEVVQVPMQHYSPEEVARARKMIAQVDSPKIPFLDRVKVYKIMALELRSGDTLPMSVQVVRLSDDAALVALPGEIFVDLGLAIKRGSPFARTAVIELAQDAPGYVPTRKAFAEGSYETVNSRIRPGGGEMLVETALKLLGELKSR